MNSKGQSVRKGNDGKSRDGDLPGEANQGGGGQQDQQQERNQIEQQVLELLQRLRYSQNKLDGIEPKLERLEAKKAELSRDIADIKKTTQGLLDRLENMNSGSSDN